MKVIINDKEIEVKDSLMESLANKGIKITPENIIKAEKLFSMKVIKDSEVN